QSVTISAVDDNALEGEKIYTISHSLTSADEAYNALTANQVNVTVHDNDARLYVKKNAGGSQTGKSWQNAFTELRDALAAVIPGQEIWVATETYTPTDTGDRTRSFTLKSNVALYGGFIGNETSLS